MVFSAMALVAFTATSMAGEIEEINVSSIKRFPCYDQYLSDLKDLQDVLPCDEAEAEATILWEACMNDTYGSK